MKEGKVIYNRLTNNGALTTLLGGSKVYPLRAPQLSAFPYIVYTTISTDANETKDGQSTTDTARVQLDQYASTYTAAADIAKAVRNIMETTTGTVNGVEVDSIHFINTNTFYNDELKVFQVSSDYSIRIKNPTT